MRSIVIVEDHPIMREGLASFFAETGRWQVLGTASTLDEAKGLLDRVNAVSSTEARQGRGFPLDVLLLDIRLKDGSGFDLIPRLALQAAPAAPLIAVYTNYDDYGHVSAAMSLGVRAYITKNRTQEELEEALNTALSGGLYIDEETETKSKITEEKLHLLTKRETEIFYLLKEGLSNKDIAAKLDLNQRTVENLVSYVYDKIGIRKRVQVERL
jgi:DNA-binding NarL/FixJ family response regulator